jgi:hypothetical protein
MHTTQKKSNNVYNAKNSYKKTNYILTEPYNDK